MVEGLLGELGSSVNAVHQLQGTGAVIVGVLPAVREPVLKACGLVGKADAQQAVESEGRVTNPSIPIVPVALSTDRLRHAASGSRHDSAGWLEGQKLERQSGTLAGLSKRRWNLALDHRACAVRMGMRQLAPSGLLHGEVE